MKKLLLIALALSLSASNQVRASWDCGNVNAVPFAHETLTVSSTSKILTAATYNPTDPPRASEALISVNTNSIRLWADGSAPTASVGILISAGQTVVVCSSTLPRVQMIRVTSDADVAVQYSGIPN